MKSRILHSASFFSDIDSFEITECPCRISISHATVFEQTADQPRTARSLTDLRVDGYVRGSDHQEGNQSAEKFAAEECRVRLPDEHG